VLSFLGQGKLVIAVIDNHTAMEVPHSHAYSYGSMIMMQYFDAGTCLN
jgi:hypothetical protein